MLDEASPQPDGSDRRRPIPWHIIKGYSAHGFRDFVIALEYKGKLIKDYCLNYYHHAINLTMKRGFFVLRHGMVDYIEGDDTVFERGRLEQLGANGRLSAHRQEESRHPMDTLRDLNILESLWQSAQPPWKVWT